MPTVASLCSLARQNMRMGAYQQAMRLAQYILVHYPKSIEAHCVLGEAWAVQGEASKAGEYFRLVLSADPEHVTALIGLGVSYRDRGRRDGALVEFERALELQPDNPRLRHEVARLRSLYDETPRDRVKPTRGTLGRIYLRSGLYQRAAKELKTVLDADPSRLDVALALAEALWRADRFSDSAQVCRNILDMAPDCLKAKLLLTDMCLSGEAPGDPRAVSADCRNLDPDNRMASVLFGDTPSAAHWDLQPAEVPGTGELEKEKR